MTRSQTIIYLDRSATLLRRQLSELSTNGLIRDVLLVAGKDDVERLEKGEFIPTSLDRELARARLELIRVVALRVEKAPSDAVLQLERDTLDSLRDRGQAVGIEFKSYTVVVVSAGQEVDRRCFHPDWTANVIVVPEESAGGEGFIAIDLSPDKVEAVGLAALTLVGGLWSWIDRGVLDEENAPNVGGVTFVRLVRLSLRVVDAGDLTSRLIGWAMDPGGVWPIPHEYVVHDQPGELLDDLASEIANSPEARFAFSPYVPKNPPRPKAVGLVAAIVLFYSRLWAFIVRMPMDYVERMKDRVVGRVEKFVQDKTFGDDSSIVVRINQRPETAAELTTTRVRAGLLANLKEVGIVSTRPTPDTWRLVRSVCFGLVDGGDFHGSMKGSEPQWLGQRAVITERQLVAPAPGLNAGDLYFEIRALELCALGIRAVEGTFLRPFDVPSVDLFSNRLAECESEARSEPTDQSWLPDMWRALVQPDMLDGPMVLLGGSEQETDVVDDEEDFEDEEPTDEDEDAESDDTDAVGGSKKASPSASLPALEAPSRGFVLERLRERFDEWMESRRASLTWKLGEQLDSAIQAAVADFEAASHDFESVIAEVEEREESLKKVNRRIRRWVKIALLVIVLLVLGAVGAWVFLSAVIAYYLLGGVAALLIGVPLSMYRSAKQLTRLEFRLEQLASRPEMIIERRRHASAEVTRLSNLVDQLGDWSEIISSVIHRPWGRRGMDPDIEPWVAQSGSHVFSVGVPRIDEEALESEITRLRKHLARTEWLSKVYVQHEAEWAKRYARLTATTPGVGSDPSSDLSPGTRPIGATHNGENVYRPRRQFRIDVVNDRFADVLRAERVEALRRNIDDENTPALLGAVKCDVDDLSGLDSTQFLRPVIEQSPLPTFNRFMNLRVGGADIHPRYSVFGASEKAGAILPEDGHERREIEVGGVASRYVLAAFRLDVSEDLQFDDVAIMAPPPRGTSPQHYPESDAPEPIEFG